MPYINKPGLFGKEHLVKVLSNVFYFFLVFVSSMGYTFWPNLTSLAKDFQFTINVLCNSRYIFTNNDGKWSNWSVQTNTNPNSNTSLGHGKEPHVYHWPLNMHKSNLKMTYTRAFALHMFSGPWYIQGFSCPATTNSKTLNPSTCVH